MPFVSAYRPSIQIGLLKAVASDRGFIVDTYHLYLDFARLLGVNEYESICAFRPRQLGDWLFSIAAFGESVPDLNASFLTAFASDVQHVFSNHQEPQVFASAARLETVPAYIQHLLRNIDWAKYAVVGFTSTFQQTVSSIALARGIKALHPHITTIIGGANVDGPMGRELSKAVNCFDFIVSGEADHSFVDLLTKLDDKRSHRLNVFPSRRYSIDQNFIASAPVDDLPSLPVPDYREYFSRADALGVISRVSRHRVQVPFESSRGCWWGQKYHCIFCGLNGTTMKFRSKLPKRVIAELKQLAATHGVTRFEAVDNYNGYDVLKTAPSSLRRS